MCKHTHLSGAHFTKRARSTEIRELDLYRIHPRNQNILTLDVKENESLPVDVLL